MFSLCIHLLAPPSPFPSLLRSPPTPSLLPSVSQSVRGAQVFPSCPRWLRRSWSSATRLRQGPPAAASYGCVDCVRQGSCLAPRRKKKKNLEKHSDIFYLFPLFFFVHFTFLFLFLSSGGVLFLSFLPSSAPFAPRQIRSRAVRTGTRRSYRTRTVQTQQDFFS